MEAIIEIGLKLPDYERFTKNKNVDDGKFSFLNLLHLDFDYIDAKEEERWARRIANSTEGSIDDKSDEDSNEDSDEEGKQKALVN